MKRIFIILATIVGLLFGVAGPASAQAPGTIYAKHSAYSQSDIKFLWQASNGVTFYSNLTPGQFGGEGTSYNSVSEPGQFFTGGGWCVDWRINDGTWATTDARGTSGLWTSVYPGSGFTGTWLVQTYSYNC